MGSFSSKIRDKLHWPTTRTTLHTQALSTGDGIKAPAPERLPSGRSQGQVQVQVQVPGSTRVSVGGPGALPGRKDSSSLHKLKKLIVGEKPSQEQAPVPLLSNLPSARQEARFSSLFGRASKVPGIEPLMASLPPTKNQVAECRKIFKRAQSLTPFQQIELLQPLLQAKIPGDLKVEITAFLRSQFLNRCSPEDQFEFLQRSAVQVVPQSELFQHGVENWPPELLEKGGLNTLIWRAGHGADGEQVSKALDNVKSWKPEHVEQLVNTLSRTMFSGTLGNRQAMLNRTLDLMHDWEADRKGRVLMTIIRAMHTYSEKTPAYESLVQQARETSVETAEALQDLEASWEEGRRRGEGYVGGH